MASFEVGPLPEAPLAAASRFYADVLPDARSVLAGRPDHLVLLFRPADHSHRSWRVAVIEELAREFAPVRVNAVAADDAAAISATVEYLARAPGLTGQYLLLDGVGAGSVL